MIWASFCPTVFNLTSNRSQIRSWQLCNEQIQWDQQWNFVVFSEESRFCLGTYDDGRHRGRHRGQIKGYYGCHGTYPSPLIFIEGSTLHAKYKWRFGTRCCPYIYRTGNAVFIHSHFKTISSNWFAPLTTQVFRPFANWMRLFTASYTVLDCATTWDTSISGLCVREESDHLIFILFIKICIIMSKSIRISLSSAVCWIFCDKQKVRVFIRRQKKNSNLSRFYYDK